LFHHLLFAAFCCRLLPEARYIFCVKSPDGEFDTKDVLGWRTPGEISGTPVTIKKARATHAGLRGDFVGFG